ncbi:autoinducer binding domain-containing protein [Albirhodobacter sp. R86504]|jgi:LuxR family transcriptional regulator|uniref:autoinducer binding domain-containing protein n=1 Tax=Albirhodobacter sp. R86504 TaxID=3093848 RepID=UPI003672C181
MNSNIPQHLQPLIDTLDQMSDAGLAIGLQMRFAHPVLLVSTYPTAWLEVYDAEGLMLHDPLIHWSMSNTGVIRWDDIQIADTKHVFARGREFGLNHGIACAVGPLSCRSMAGFCRKNTPFSVQEMGTIHGILQDLHDLSLAA